VTQSALVEAIRLTPLEEHVIWCGRDYLGRTASMRATVAALVPEVWKPVAMREIMLRASRITDDLGIAPERVRRAFKNHQTAAGACHFVVIRTADGHFVAAADIPMPAVGAARLKGDLVLSRNRKPFCDLLPTQDGASPSSGLRRAS
jgi:hypothetical protein